MGRNKKSRKPRTQHAPKPRPTNQDLIKWGKYTLVYDPTATDDKPVEIKVRPRLRSKGGAAAPSANLKLAPNILVEDSRTPAAFPVISKDLLRVTDKRVLSDGGGNYASIWLQLNRSFPDLATFLQSKPDGMFEIRVTLFVDMGGIVGAAAGMALPAGSVAVPVPGNTNVRIRLVEQWKLSFSKFKWKEQKDIELNKLPDADLDELNDLAENGGTLDIVLDAGLSLGKDEAIYADKPLIGAEIKLLRPGKPDLTAVYDEDLELYSFAIPAPPGAQGADGNSSASFFIEVWVADEIQNRLGTLITKTRELDGILNGNIAGDAEKFVQACLDVLAAKTVQELQDNDEKFTNATHAVTYFEAFTLLVAKGMDESLRLHQKAYDRYMENLINGMIELLFIAGDKLFDWLLSKIIKNGRAAMEEELKKEAKTLAEAAADSAERAILPKKQTAEAARDQLASECRSLSNEAMGGMKQAAELTETIAKQETDITEKNMAKEGLQKEMEGLGKAVEDLEKQSRELAKKVEELGGKVTEAETLKNQAKSESEQLLGEIEQLRTQASGVRAEISNANESLAKVTSDLESTRSLLGEKRGALQKATSELETASHELSSLRRQEQEVSVELGRLEREHTRLTELMESGHATSEQLKTLEHTERQMETAASRSEQIAQNIRSQDGLVASRKTQKQELEGVVSNLDENAKKFETRSTDLNSKIEGLDDEAKGIENQVLEQSNKQSKAAQRQSDLEREMEDLQKQKGAAKENIDRVEDDMKAARSNIEDKRTKLENAAEELDKLKEEVRKSGEKRTDLRNQSLEKIRAVNQKVPQVTEAEWQVEEIAAQLELLQKIKSSARGSEAEFQAALERAIQEIPSDQQMTRKVLESLKTNSGLGVLKEWETQLEGMRQGLSGEELAQVDRTLKTVRESVDKIERAETLWEGRSKIITKNITYTIKEELNERVKKIRDALQRMTHVEYKAVPAKYYDDTYFDQLCALCDAFLEKLGQFWNWLMSGAISAHDWAHQHFGELMDGADKLTLYAIGACLYALDLFLQLLMKLAEGILYIANSPMFASSWIQSDCRSKVKNPSRAIPGSLPQEFFKFSNEMVTKAAQRVHPKQIAQQSGGKAQILGAIKEEFKGYYKEYYEPQWERARQFMVDLAGAAGALNPKWLDSDDVKSENREATRLLQAILSPMIRYSNSFEAGDDGVLATLMTAYYTGDWTPHDADVIFECAAWGCSWGLRLGGMVFILIPPLEPAVPVMMEASDWTDRLFALARIATTALYTMPDILGAQFDVMRVYSLAYQNVFNGEDISGALLGNREYAWGD